MWTNPSKKSRQGAAPPPHPGNVCISGTSDPAALPLPGYNYDQDRGHDDNEDDIEDGFVLSSFVVMFMIVRLIYMGRIIAMKVVRTSAFSLPCQCHTCHQNFVSSHPGNRKNGVFDNRPIPIKHFHL